MGKMGKRKRAVAAVKKHCARIRRDLNLPIDLPRYRFPKGYVPWEELGPLIEGEILAGALEGKKRSPGATRLFGDSVSLWAFKHGPIYALDADLLEAFKLSDIGDDPSFFLDYHPPVPAFVLLFPQGAIARPEGGYIDWVVVNFWDADDPTSARAERWGLSADLDWFADNFAEKSKFRAIASWTGIDSEGSSFFSTRAFRRDGSFKPSPYLGEETDREWAYQFREIVLQTLLYLSISGEAEGEIAPQKPTRGGGFGSPKDAPLSPRWIGRGYKLREPSGRSSSGGKRTWHVPGFWRRGHWRSVPCGRGRLARKTVYIKPRYVDVEKSGKI